MSAATGYERRIGRYSEPLAEGMAALVPLAPGRRVLDVGCGSGQLTRVLARAVGAEHVAAVDVAAADVEACARRMPGVDARVAAAERLPFADDAFDAVLAQRLVHLVDDAPRAASEMRRVARPGAPVVTCVWDFAEGMTALRAFWDAVAATGAPGAELHDQSAYAYATPAELEQLWTSAGMTGVESGELRVSARYADFDDLWEPLAVPDGSPGRYLATLEGAHVAAIRDELRRRAGHPRGRFHLDARAWYVRGDA
jgi:SAM-dependent methyltransferase